jgi:hypothetical protein
MLPSVEYSLAQVLSATRCVWAAWSCWGRFGESSLAPIARPAVSPQPLIVTGSVGLRLGFA